MLPNGSPLDRRFQPWGLVPTEVGSGVSPPVRITTTLKVLLKEFFEGFFLCFFPAWAARFEFHEIDWLDKEMTIGGFSWPKAWRLTLISTRLSRNGCKRC